MNWKYNTEFDINDYEGFVYIITIKSTGQRYIGRKSFWTRSTLKPLKGFKRKRKTICESKWQDYKSSHLLIKTLKEEDLDKTIICLCKNKIEMTYNEYKYQFEYDAIIDENYLNSNIGGKFYRGRV
jgi:hypothetical protein